MANTVTNTRTNLGLKHTVQQIAIASDGTEETALVIYDSSVVAAALGITDPLNCIINKITYSSNSVLGVVHILWDATTDVLAWAMPAQGNNGTFCFDDIGGLKNAGGAGRTGDILLTTTGLAIGDSITLILDVRVV